MFLSNLPPELQQKILLNLDGLSLANAECVCKLWYDILTTSPFNLVWRRECLCDIEETVLVQLTGIEDISVAELRYTARSGNMKMDTRAWKAVYKKWHTCKKAGHWPVIKSEIKANEANVHYIEISGDIIFTAHGDWKIRLWDSWTGACLQTLSGHHDAVLCIALYHRPVHTLDNEQRPPQLIASGSADAEVRIWNVENGSCQSVFTNHNHSVNCLGISKERVISASFDGRIYVWDLFQNNLCMNIERAHCNPILYLSVWRRTAVSVAQDEIKFCKFCPLNFKLKVGASAPNITSPIIGFKKSLEAQLPQLHMYRRKAYMVDAISYRDNGRGYEVWLDCEDIPGRHFSSPTYAVNYAPETDAQ